MYIRIVTETRKNKMTEIVAVDHTKVLEIEKFTFTKSFGEGTSWPTEVCMEWVEESTYCMHPDSDMDMDITREASIKLINFLKESWKIGDDELNLAKIK